MVKLPWRGAAALDRLRKAPEAVAAELGIPPQLHCSIAAQPACQALQPDPVPMPGTSSRGNGLVPEKRLLVYMGQNRAALPDPTH